MRIFGIYLAIVNLVLCAMMGIDKFAAKAGKRRIPERALFTLAALGGALGGTVGMYSFRHKTKHASFVIGFPILTLLWIVITVLLIRNFT